MKILVLTQYFHPENFLINSLVDIIKDDFEVDVLCPFPSYPKASIFKNNNWSNFDFVSGLSQYKIHRIRSRLRNGDGIIHLIFVGMSFILSSTIWLIFHRKKYDVIFSHLPSPVLLGMAPIFAFRPEKKILWILDLWPNAVISKFQNSKIPKFIYRFAELLIRFIIRIMYEKSNIIATHTKEMVRHLEIESGKEVFLFPQWEINVVPNFDHPQVKRTQDFCKNFKLNVVNSGNFGVHQDIDLLIDLTAACPNIGFVFIGDGSRWSDLSQRLIGRGPKNVLLIDRVPQSVLMALIGNFDVGLSTLKAGGGLSKILPRRVNFYMQAGLIPIAQGTANTFEDLDDGLDALRSSSDSPINDLIDKLTAIEEMSHEKLGKLKYKIKELYAKKYSESAVREKFHMMLS